MATVCRMAAARMEFDAVAQQTRRQMALECGGVRRRFQSGSARCRTPKAHHLLHARLIANMRRILPVVILLFLAASAAAQDVLTLGTGTAPSAGTASVPIYVL